MSVNKIEYAKSLGAAFANVFLNVQENVDGSFNWDKFYKKHKDEVREKLGVLYENKPVEFEQMQEAAEEGFKQRIEELKKMY